MQGQTYNRQFATSSRSSSTETAGDEMVNAGVIYVTSAGNSNQRLGLGLSDPHLNDYLTTLNGADNRAGIPGSGVSGTVPSGHRNYIHPANIGYNTTTDYHPAVCVGAMDDYIESNYQERKASYSNNGPGVDVWAPADETLSAGTNGVAAYEDFQRYDDDRFYDCRFNGTSAAAPVATGVLALYLQSNPSATSIQVKDWLRNHGSKVIVDYQDSQTDDTQTDYWTFSYSLRGAEKRILFNPFTNNTTPSIEGLNMVGVTFSQI